MLPLKLEKPLAIFDIESTGLNPRLDRIIELAIIKLFPDGNVKHYSFKLNPEIPIPAEATALHHITDADVIDCPLFKDVAKQVLDIFNDCDLGGFGIIRFDVPMLIEEFARVGIKFDDNACNIIDVQRIFHKKEPRNLSAALSFYCGESHVNAHGAEPDAEATLSVLEAQLRKYADLPHTIRELNSYCRKPRDPTWLDRTGKLKWSNNEVVINFGVKCRGISLHELRENNPKFLKWILTSDFPTDTKEIISGVLEGRFPDKPTS
mgnify:CR=1 FL=1